MIAALAQAVEQPVIGNGMVDVPRIRLAAARQKIADPGIRNQNYCV